MVLVIDKDQDHITSLKSSAAALRKELPVTVCKSNERLSRGIPNSTIGLPAITELKGMIKSMS